MMAARDEEKLFPWCNEGFLEELGHDGVGEDVGGSGTSGGGHPAHFHPPPMMMRWGGRRWMREWRYHHGPPPHLASHPMEVHMEMVETMNALLSSMDGHGSDRILRVRHGPGPSDPMVLVGGLADGVMDEEGTVDVFHDDRQRRFGFGMGRMHHHGHVDDMTRRSIVLGHGQGKSENGIAPLPSGGFVVGRFSRPRGSSNTTNESSSCRNSSIIFRRGGFVSDLGMRVENQGKVGAAILCLSYGHFDRPEPIQSHLLTIMDIQMVVQIILDKFILSHLHLHVAKSI